MPRTKTRRPPGRSHPILDDFLEPLRERVIAGDAAAFFEAVLLCGDDPWPRWMRDHMREASRALLDRHDTVPLLGASHGKGKHSAFTRRRVRQKADYARAALELARRAGNRGDVALAEAQRYLERVGIRHSMDWIREHATRPLDGDSLLSLILWLKQSG